MILVTGGMGFIGLHVVRSLLDAGQDVVLTWNRSWRVPDFWADEVGKRVLTERVDVSNPYEVMGVAAQHKVESIIHLAAPGIGQSAVTQDYSTNMLGLINVIEAARAQGVRRSTEAFKKAGEIMLLHYAERYKLDVVSVRPRAVYGPLYYSMSNLPSRLAHAAVKGVEPNYGPAGIPYAEDTGDFTYVKDCAEVTRVVHLADRLQHRTYNVGGGRAFTMQELADAVRSVVSDAKIQLQPGQNPRGNPRDNYLDLSRVKDEFGFTPSYPVEKGMPDYIRWLGSHEQ